LLIGYNFHAAKKTHVFKFKTTDYVIFIILHYLAKPSWEGLGKCFHPFFLVLCRDTMAGS